MRITSLLSALLAISAFQAALPAHSMISSPAAPAVVVTTGIVDGYVQEVIGTRLSPSIGATVVLTNTTTNVKVTATTQPNGYFRMGAVPVGTYTTKAYKGSRSGTSSGVRIAPPFALTSRVNFTIR